MESDAATSATSIFYILLIFAILSIGLKSIDCLSTDTDTKWVLILLVLISVAVAFFAYSKLGVVISSALIGISYPIVGAIVVKFCTLLRKIACPDEIDFSEGTILWLTSIWPITLVVSLFLYPGLFFIHLLF